MAASETSRNDLFTCFLRKPKFPLPSLHFPYQRFVSKINKKIQTPDKLIFKMSRGGNLLLVSPVPRRTDSQYELRW